MTVELGNINKGIPMGSYAPGEGGGGAAKVTGVDPIAVTNGSVAIKIDEQTLQVNEQGELSANLDELGNEVNTLAGEVAGVQADLPNKQDKFETQVPLSISSNSIATSVATGITETAESWTGGGPDKLVSVNVSALNIDANSDWKIHLSGYIGNYHSTNTNTNALSISTENEQIFRVWFGSAYFRLGNGTAEFTQIPDENREFYYEIVHQKNDTKFTFNGTSLVKPDPLLISTMSQALGQGAYTTLAGKGKLKGFFFVINSYLFQRIDKDISKSYFEADGVKYPITSVEGLNTLKLGVGDGLSVVDGKLTASSTAPANMVTTDTAQTITGTKTFKYIGIDDAYGGRTRLGNGQSKIEMAYDGQTSVDSATILADQSQNWRVGRYNKAGLIYSASALKRVGNGPTFNRYDILDSSNLGSYVDGTTITYTNSKLSAVGGGASDTEKYGLEGDYCSKYGIVDCPNGILAEGTGQVTLKAGVVMQMTETDGLTTNASDMPHDITSTVDFDLFYTSGSLLEATQVVFSEQEPEDGATGVLAWYNGTQWQFKSNDAGNVWKSAPAVRLAHIHITDGNITRIDYIGNRHLNKVIPVTTDTAQTITGIKTFPAYTKFNETIQFTGTLSRIQNAYGNNLFLDDKSNNTIQLGEASRTTILSNTVKDSSGNKFLTSGDKETIMGYMMPDYSTRTEVPWNTDNTAPTDGYVEVFGEGDGSTSAYVLEYTLNGVKTAVSGCYATSSHTNFRLPVICPKGTVYSARGGANGHELYFISMKGAV